MASKVTDGDLGVVRNPSDKSDRSGDRGRAPYRALVVTVSDRVTAGVRDDASGDHLAQRLVALGFAVDRAIVPDEQAQISQLLTLAAGTHALILTTGGTGLTPRDVTPQATKSVLEYEVPGIPELMRAEGARSTPYAYLSRAVAGILNRCLIVNLPGSTRGVRESMAALEPILTHALGTIAGPFDHDPAESSARATSVVPEARPPR
jgi:molybdenum cofactor synthesis domain-containing protein